MSTNSPQEAHEDADVMPADEDLVAPSTEADPGEEPKSEKPREPAVDHQAVGIGVVGRPLNDADDSMPSEPSTDVEESGSA